MTAIPTNGSPRSEYAKAYIAALGFALVPIEPGSKSPIGQGWNQPGGYFDDPEKAASYWETKPAHGMGAVLGPSRIVTIDLDHYAEAIRCFLALGIELEAVLNLTVRIQGRPGRGKAVFRLPDGIDDLKTRCCLWPDSDKDALKPKPMKVFELRAGLVQDVLPPTIHPDTNEPYAWIGDPLTDIAELPPELLAIWGDGWSEAHAKMKAACPWYVAPPEKLQRAARRYTTTLDQQSDSWAAIRAELRQRCGLDDMLREMGAKHAGGAKWLCPFHDEKKPSFWTWDTGQGFDLWICSHGDAPVGMREAGAGSVGDVIDLFQFHNGSPTAGKACADLAKRVGLRTPRPEQKPAGKTVTMQRTGTYGQGEAPAIEEPPTSETHEESGIPDLEESPWPVDLPPQYLMEQPTSGGNPLVNVADASAVTNLMREQSRLAELVTLRDNQPGLYQAELERLRASGIIPMRVVDNLARAVTGEARNKRRSATPGLRLVGPDDEIELAKVKRILNDAPVPNDTAVPAGWILTRNGIRREVARRSPDGNTDVSQKVISEGAVVISGIMQDVVTNNQSWRISWYTKRWNSHTCSQATAVTRKGIVQVADKGLPVSDNTAKDLIDYLVKFESQNRNILPSARISSTMGWQGKNGKLGFLLGRSLINDNGIQSTDMRVSEPSDWHSDSITFHSADEGEDQLADGFQTEGTYEEWLKAVVSIQPFPIALATFYSSFVPPLLQIFGAPNFVMDLCYPTSRGKTTALRVAGSVWGCPDDRAGQSVLWPWNATPVWIERSCSALNGLPLILDDTAGAKNKEVIAQILYSVANGRGKGRGSEKGIQRTGSWRTVLISSGESPVASFSEDGGSRARVITLWGPPIPDNGGDSALFVTDLTRTVCDNYGHAGPLFLGFLAANRSRWPEWKKAYYDRQNQYLTLTRGNSVASRFCPYLAALDMAAYLAHEALRLPWAVRQVIRGQLLEQVLGESKNADKAKRAMLMLVNWAIAHRQEFFGQHASGRNAPNNGWAGRWDLDGEEIGIFPLRVDTLLREQGYEPEAITRAWKDRGWLKLGKKHEPHRNVWMDGKSPRLLVINKAAMSEITDEPQEALTTDGAL